MASEYLKWKYRDVRADRTAELTPSEKRKNWWHYHKWHVAAGAALLAILGSILWNALTRAEPDYSFAYVGASCLPDDTAAALESALAAFGEDLNGDGKVEVIVRQYVFSGADAGMAASAEVALIGDILECESYFFLLENPEAFQEMYHTLCRIDGSLPLDDTPAGDTYLHWPQCPVLSSLELGDYAYQLMGKTASGHSQDILSKLYFARRGFWTEKTTPHPDGCEALWNKLTEGAVS